MWIADSTAFAGTARQSSEQIAAAGDADQTKHAAPKAPRLGVENDQRQPVVEARQGLMHDRAFCSDGSPLLVDGPPLLARRHGQYHGIGVPLDVDISDSGRQKVAGAAGLRAPP